MNRREYGILFTVAASLLFSTLDLWWNLEEISIDKALSGCYYCVHKRGLFSAYCACSGVFSPFISTG